MAEWSLPELNFWYEKNCRGFPPIPSKGKGTVKPPKTDRATATGSLTCTENLVKFGHVVTETCLQTNSQRDRQTDTLVATLPALP